MTGEGAEGSRHSFDVLVCPESLVLGSRSRVMKGRQKSTLGRFENISLLRVVSRVHFFVT